MTMLLTMVVVCANHTWEGEWKVSQSVVSCWGEVYSTLKACVPEVSTHASL